MKERIGIVLVLLVAVLAILSWRAGTPRPTGPAASPSAMPPHDATRSPVPAPPLETPPPPALPAPASSPDYTAATQATPIVRPASTPAATLPASPAEPALPLPPESDISADLEHVELMFRDYRAALGENPVGTNAEITRALLGDNLKQVRIEIPQGSRVNGEGELVDRWGTPFFFHQISGKKTEIRSAGPDRIMWTADDRQQ